MVHSDRGSQFRSGMYVEVLGSNGLQGWTSPARQRAQPGDTGVTGGGGANHVIQLLGEAAGRAGDLVRQVEEMT